MSVTTPDPTIEFVGLYADQTEEVILDRWIAWANEGLDPVEDAARWTDTREGGHWRTGAVGMIRECARLYDLMGTEVPMSAFVLWAWGPYLDDLAAAYRVQRLIATSALGVETFAGPAGTLISLGTTVATVATGPDDPTPAFSVTEAGVIPDAGGGSGSVDLPIQAREPGKAGDVAALAITVASTPLPSGVTVTNAAATIGGTDPETDESLRSRVLEAILGSGGANVAAYLRWARQYPGVGAAKVVPTPTGPNSVLVMLTDPDGQPLPGSVVTGFQDEVDPVAGKGAGLAPVGARVDVETSVPLAIAVTVASIVYDVGYSADGAGDTIALRSPIGAAISAYLFTVRPGDEAVLAEIAGIIATWGGIHDLSGVELNGVAANVAVPLSPPGAPYLASLAL